MEQRLKQSQFYKVAGAAASIYRPIKQQSNDVVPKPDTDFEEKLDGAKKHTEIIDNNKDALNKGQSLDSSVSDFLNPGSFKNQLNVNSAQGVGFSK